MTVKVKKTEKKDNLNNNITENTKALLDEIQNNFNESKTMADDVKEKFTNKAKEASQTIPNAMQSLNERVMDMQQQLFAINMNFYSKSLTCYSFAEMNQLYSNYTEQVVNCCLDEGNKVNDLLFKANSDLVKQMI